MLVVKTLVKAGLFRLESDCFWVDLKKFIIWIYDLIYYLLLVIHFSSFV